MAFEELRIEMKCKDFRIEVEDGLKSESLSIAGQSHAADCRPCREFHQKHVEFREWLTVCEKITAPKDFQFGVQRKIAGGNYAHSHGWAWSRLKYIVPATALTAILVLAGFYAFNNGTAANQGRGVATIAPENRNPNTAKDENVQAPVVVQPEIQKPGDEKIAAAVNTNKQDKNLPPAVQKEGPGGSVDSTLKDVKDPETPKGFDLTRKGSVQSQLLQLGVITGWDNGLIKITLVKANSAGARAGVKVGDNVDSWNGNVLTVKRGDRAMQFTLK